jgi:hypothetical protein
VKLLRDAVTLLLTPDGRKAGAFLAVLLGCTVMTLYAAAVLAIVRGNARYAFWLGMAAHFHVLLGLTCFGAHLVRRTIKASRDGIQITDEAVNDQAQPPTVTTKTTVTVDPGTSARAGGSA